MVVCSFIWFVHHLFRLLESNIIIMGLKFFNLKIVFLQMTCLDYLNTEAVNLSRVVPRISVWNNETVRLYERLDLVSQEDGTYGALSASLYVYCVFIIFPCLYYFHYLLFPF